MIRVKLAIELGKNKMSKKKLSDLTGIRSSTVSALYYEKAKRIDLKMMNELCKALNCQVSDLFEYEENKEEYE